MKHWVFLAGAVILLLAVGMSTAGPLRKSPFGLLNKEKLPVNSFDTQFITDTFKGGELSRVIAIGDGASYLGLYIYDAYGNCVAWDDEANYSTRDDLAVDWFPGIIGDYTVELRNFGINPNRVQLAIR